MATFDFGAMGASALNFIGARNANRATRAMAREQMEFQERMSNTAYQRQAEDMRKAGLNPILGLNSSGSSSPAGATAQMQNEFAGALSSAIEVRRANAEIENLRAQNKQIDAVTELTRMQARATASELPLKELKGDAVATAAGFAKQVLDSLQSLGKKSGGKELWPGGPKVQ